MSKTALISVSDKTGIVDFAKGLIDLGWEIISSGGTAKTLKQHGLHCRQVSDVTGFPEILDGRVKTLNPKVHGAILAVRQNANHQAELKKHSINPIDMVVVNLYPFEQVVSKIPQSQDKNISDEVIENIDIGGAALLRAAAKNFRDVLVICDIDDYKIVLEKLKSGQVDSNFRLSLCAKAFGHTAYYDAIISNYLTCEKFPKQSAIAIKKVLQLRYGENPHQQAALYLSNADLGNSSVVEAKQIHGKELSYNNYLDIEAAWMLVNEFSHNACAIIKHNNPCGCAIDASQEDAFLLARQCDPTSAFGGVIAFNKEVTKETAVHIKDMFIECIIAPKFSLQALDILKEKKNLRLLEQPKIYKKVEQMQYKTLTNGMLVQEGDNQLFASLIKATVNDVNKEVKRSLEFAWKVVKHVKSNAIVLARGFQTVGIGAGQMSRIDAFHIAVKKMREIKDLASKEPLILASDAFFPFGDVVEAAAEIGVAAIIWPSGSIRDGDSIDAANAHNIAMFATNMRHFKH
ncbi:MAG: bifunctional phosphoribosylaminoimidazolecarboxamide formyltransferase/IMP cyclohydrolase [Elusimicrobiota bacterium]|jgi:phosphoribosylaminoimidazolecarboxamide formyltransferase/IMP cyclohydrolase|nr:bifunctional phosphoribosylaminoimidazolecarboxamide formyltransferase/IMP cyclohydrolase [Elusimicrobiota bacterium]